MASKKTKNTIEVHAVQLPYYCIAVVLTEDSLGGHIMPCNGVYFDQAHILCILLSHCQAAKAVH